MQGDTQTLERRWAEHRDAARHGSARLGSARLGDLENQWALGLSVDDESLAWERSQNADYLARIAGHHRRGTAHWTGKRMSELIAGAASRPAPSREDWEARARLLSRASVRASLVTNLGLHHSPASSQNWYAPAHELLPDALRHAWLMFWLHSAIAIEDLVPVQVEAGIRLD